MALRLAFMGTPEFSVPFLRALHQAGHEIAAVYTQPPRQSGRRGLSETPSPVQKAALALGLSVFTPKTLRDKEAQAQFAALNLDAAIVVAYGLLLPEAVLEAPRLGCYNAHGSLLPRWRGAAPVQRAIEAGDTETGLMIMRMDKGLDTGPILSADETADSAFVHKLPIEADMTAGELFAAMAKAGAALMVQAAQRLESGKFCLLPQTEQGACYAQKIEKHETRIGWQKTAQAAHQHIRALSPAPGAWCEMQFAAAERGKASQTERVKILASHLPSAAELAAARERGIALFQPGAESAAETRKAAVLAVQCGGEAGGAANMLFLTKLQKAGGTALPAAEFLRRQRIERIL